MAIASRIVLIASEANTEPNLIMPTSKSKPSGVQVIARAAAIMQVLKTEKDGATLGGIAERVNLPRSTVQRIVNALITENLVAPAGYKNGYRLGSELQLLATAGQIQIIKEIEPFLERAAEFTKETVNCSLAYKDQMVIIYQVIGTQKLRTVSTVGVTNRMTTTANGKAALAFLNKAAVTRIISAEIGSDSTQKVRLEQQLEKIRAGSFAYNLDENQDHICALGFGFKEQSGLFFPSPCLFQNTVLMPSTLKSKLH